jgi:hypothetical protein
VNQRLAVEAHVAALHAFAAEAALVLDVVVDAVEDVDAVGMGREDCGGLVRVSLARSLVPIMKPARRVSPSRATAAMSAALRMAIGVSIIAHSQIRWPAARPVSRAVTACRSVDFDTLGTRIPSGPAWAAACRSSIPHAVSRPLMRTITSRAPKPRAATAAMTWSRAAALASGATASSRSRMTASQGSVFAFSRALALAPGM